MATPAPLTVRRYVARGVSRRPLRSGLASAGVAVAVAFFVLFGSLSAGLHDHVAGELARARPAHIYLSRLSPTPYGGTALEAIREIVARAMEGAGRGEEGRDWNVTPRVMLTLSAPPEGAPLRLWGVAPGGLAGPPPGGAGARLDLGRHLTAADDAGNGTVLPCVMGATALARLFPGNDGRAGIDILLGPDESVDPWWFPSASDYDVSVGGSYVEVPRGPFPVEVVGTLAPGQGDGLDSSVLVPVHPLLRALDQYDAAFDLFYYPEVVVTIADGGRVDVASIEEAIGAAVPLTGGTDDGWDRAAFERTYGDVTRTLDSWLVIITAVMALMLAAGVSDTMLVAVADRRSEIATLRAVGTSRRRVAGLVLAEVLLLSAIGLLAGLLAGGALAAAFGHLHASTGGAGVFFAPVRLSPWVVAAAVALGVGVAALAGLYPARRAARQSPTEALRYE